jgi:acetoin utilization deacetylase AcuC-like enzyme
MTDTQGARKVALVHNPNHLLHRAESSSPENPERVTRIIQYIKARTSLLNDGPCTLISEFPPASEEDLLRVHDKTYLNFLQRSAQRGGGFLGDSTYVAPQTYNVAASAVGGAIEAIRLVAKAEYPGSFAIIRPPGHHASSDRFGGYCVLNNAAVAARYAQVHLGAKKIMIVDWDAHAGNGTMRIFYEDPTVLVVSLHRDPNEHYPHDGFGHQIGRNAGRGYNVNIEMPEGAGDAEYALTMDEIVIPLAKSFQPDEIIGLVGFDAHYKDGQSGLHMTTKGYYDIVQRLWRLKERLTLVLEGGYSSANPQIAHAVICSLAGMEPPFEEEIDALAAAVTRRKKTRAILEDNLEDLRQLLGEFHKL